MKHGTLTHEHHNKSRYRKKKSPTMSTFLKDLSTWVIILSRRPLKKGNVRLTMKGRECEVRGVLHEVLHVHNLINNLFSIKKATSQGLKIEFEQEKCNINNNAREFFAKVVKENKLYILLCLHILAPDSVQRVRKKKNLKVWHERFSHLEKQKLRFLVQKNLITSMDVRTNHQLDFCGGYVNGRQCKIFFQKGDPKKMFKTFLKLVHIYLCGLTKITLVGGA